MLGLADAAGLGGRAMLIGTLPHAISAGQIRQRFLELGKIGFLGSMSVAVLLADLYLLATW
jgi:hypothetical protein